MYLAVAVDYLTKWPFVKPLKSKRAEEISRFIDDLCAQFGYPKVLISDQGREFCNREITAICAKFAIEHRVIAPYHPQANGLVGKRTIRDA